MSSEAAPTPPFVTIAAFGAAAPTPPSEMFAAFGRRRPMSLNPALLV